MPSPLGWALAALVVTAVLALVRRRPPLRTADGGPPPEVTDWVAFARGAREVAERARRPGRERPMAMMAEWDLELVGAAGEVSREKIDGMTALIMALGMGMAPSGGQGPSIEDALLSGDGVLA